MTRFLEFLGRVFDGGEHHAGDIGGAFFILGVAFLVLWSLACGWYYKLKWKRANRLRRLGENPSASSRTSLPPRP